jgi:hypothetical protein
MAHYAEPPFRAVPEHVLSAETATRNSIAYIAVEPVIAPTLRPQGT